MLSVYPLQTCMVVVLVFNVFLLLIFICLRAFDLNVRLFLWNIGSLSGF